MVKAIFVVLSCFLCITLSAKKQSEEIPFKLAGGLIIVNAQINDTNGNFIIDTGSSDIIINQQEKTNSKNQTISTLGQDENIGEKHIESLSIGSVNLNNIKVLSADLESVEKYVKMSIEGIIGTKTFFPNSIEIDYNLNVMTISQEEVAEHLSEDMYVTSFKMNNEVPVIKIMIAGKAYNFILDSGATTHFIDNKVVGTLDTVFVDALKEVNITTTFSSENKAKVNYANKIFIGDKEYKETRFLAMSFDSLNKMSDIEIHGLISMRALSNRIILDLKQKEILFE